MRTVAAAEGSSGSKAWKCGPCVRAIEEVSHLPRLFANFHLLYSPTPTDTDLQLFCVFQGYIRALEKQERNHQLHQEETLAVNLTNSKVSLQCPLSIPGLRWPISSCLGALKSKEDNCKE